jgi:hypothetical protein
MVGGFATPVNQTMFASKFLTQFKFRTIDGVDRCKFADLHNTHFEQSRALAYPQEVIGGLSTPSLCICFQIQKFY